MVPPFRIYRRTLTGRVRGRRTWRNKLMLQVEVRCDELPFWPKPRGTPEEIIGTHYEWRDATVDDMIDKTYQTQAKEPEPHPYKTEIVAMIHKNFGKVDDLERYAGFAEQLLRAARRV